jgi:hypothetical protein
VFNSGFSETLPVFSDSRNDSVYDDSIGGDLGDSDAEDEEEIASTEDDIDLDFDDAHSTFVLATPVRATSTNPSSPNFARDHPELEPESDADGEGQRNVRQKLSHPGSPRGRPERDPPMANIVPGPTKMKVVVRDASYWTYRAVLYYVSCLPKSALTQILIACGSSIQILSSLHLSPPPSLLH